MIVECPDCNKKFDIDENLIPTNGRLLQCGSCNHKWFFKLNIIEQKPEDEIKIKPKENFNTNVENDEKTIKNEKKAEAKKIITIKKREKRNFSYFNILIVIIISSAALILVLDTFEDQLISVFPNIKFLLNNLYQSIVDIKLFILDLIK